MTIKTNSKPRTIYALYDPRDSRQTIQYVGCTCFSPDKRIREHIDEAIRTENNSSRAQWIRELILENQVPSFCILEVVPFDRWQEREQHWIQRFPNLLNATAGGLGCFGLKMSAASTNKMRASAKGRRPISEETRERMSAGQKRREPISEETRKKLSLANTGRTMSAESRAKMSAQRKGKTISAEQRMNHSKFMQEAWAKIKGTK